MTTTELQQAHLDAHNARVSARLVRAGVTDELLPYGVRLLEGEMDVDADSVLIDAVIASWRVLLPDIFGPAQVAPVTTRAPGAVFGAKGAAEAARRASSTATSQVSSAPSGRVFGAEGAAESARRFGEPNATS